MDYSARFGEILGFLTEYYPDLIDIGSESCQFFLRLNDAEFEVVTGQIGNGTVNLGIGKAPKRVGEILTNGDRVSGFEDSYEDIPQAVFRQNTPFFRGMSEKKVLEVHNFKKVLEQKLGRRDHIVEVACGVGHLANYLALTLPENISIFGLDIKPGYTKDAQDKARALDLRSQFTVRNALESMDDLIQGGQVAVVALHGCNYLSQRVLRLHQPDLLMVSPCCYNGLDPKDYFMSTYARERIAQSGLPVDSKMGEIAILGPGRIKKGDEKTKVDRLSTRIREAGYQISDEDKELLGCCDHKINGVSEDNIRETCEQIHQAKKRYALLKKLFTRSVEALFSADKAIYLGESGREGQVYCYMPYVTTPRNHLVVGRT